MMQHITLRMVRGIGLWVGLFLLVGGFMAPALAQFSSGSMGENGVFPPGAVPSGTTDITLELTGVVTFLPGGATVTLPNIPAGGFADGILKFTTVDVPMGVTLRFPSAIVPITILAQGNVNVAGTIDVSGEDGEPLNVSRGGKGGPGGFKGGQGKLTVASSRAGTGLGPGGGAGGGPGNNNNGGGSGGGFGTTGGAGPFNNIGGGNTYGIPALLPLIGGSGGGGGPALNNGNGGGGGGGGGAILIASSTTITVTGTIRADGGAGVSQGGAGGSGGAVRLMANTILGTGTLRAVGGVGAPNNGISNAGGGGGFGRIRLEAFSNAFTGTISGSSSGGVPGIIFLPNVLTVRIDSVGGVTVPAHPTGAAGGVDVVIPAPGAVSIVLKAAHVPVGTTIAVTVKPETDANIIGVTSPGLAGAFDDSTVTVDVTFPTAGLYFIEARATFMVP
jgi:hypothetical protein